MKRGIGTARSRVRPPKRISGIKKGKTPKGSAKAAQVKPERTKRIRVPRKKGEPVLKRPEHTPSRKTKKLTGPVIIAIDGPVGSGKSTIARELANRLGYLHLNTGMTYRLLVAAALDQGVPLDESALISLAGRLRMMLGPEGVRLEGMTLTRDIQSQAIADIASKVATLEGLRKALVAHQRNLAEGRNVVAEGRDTTTVVFPEATLKVYLTAREEVRARRRQLQLRERGIQANFEDVLAWLRERDQRDISREHSPLRKARDAIVVDTSDKTAAEIVSEILRRLKAT
ncbi:MAG: (d)CMP kinase [bacterium JZ-2024 1]